MNPILVASAIVLVSIVVTIAVAVLIAWDFSFLRVTDVENDKRGATKRFFDVLAQAEHELLIHDDDEGNLCDGDVVQAVRERLRACPSLKVRCLLNFNTDGCMAVLSEEYGHRFQIRYLHQQPTDDVHFKIADGGKVAYLSTCGEDTAERRGQVIEDTGTRAYVRKHRLGGFIKDFNEGFDKAHVA